MTSGEEEEARRGSSRSHRAEQDAASSRSGPSDGSGSLGRLTRRVTGRTTSLSPQGETAAPPVTHRDDSTRRVVLFVFKVGLEEEGPKNWSLFERDTPPSRWDLRASLATLVPFCLNNNPPQLRQQPPCAAVGCRGGTPRYTPPAWPACCPLVRTAGRAGGGQTGSGVQRYRSLGDTGPEMCGDGAGVPVEDSDSDRQGSLLAG